MGADNGDKESWIGALGKAMIKSSVMIDDNMDGVYMWIKKWNFFIYPSVNIQLNKMIK